jgi:lysophospholipase L1-like esterase
MLNLGVGGFYYDEASLDGISFDPDRIIVEYGANDFSHFGAGERFKENVFQYMERLKNMYGEKRIYVITPVWLSTLEDGEKLVFDECRRIIESTVKIFGYHIIKGENLLPEDITLFADEIHPNILGNKLYAENLIAEIEKNENGF